MKISIIIPVHNAQDSIERCVQSFICQNYEDLELILVNDRSTDNSVTACENLREQYPQIRLAETVHVFGASAARNVGLACATGDVIGFCDADDTANGNSLRIVAKEFSAHPEADLVVTGFRNICPTADGELVFPQRLKKNARWSGKKLLAHVLYDRRIMGSVWNKFFRRDMLKEIQFSTDLTHMEDTHFVARVLSRNETAHAYVLTDELYNYYLNPSSATNSVDRFFDGDGRLKYVVAANRILEDCELSCWARILSYRSRYILASDTYLNFSLNAQQQAVVNRIMSKDRKWFLLLWFINTKENIKRVLRTLRKQLRK